MTLIILAQQASVETYLVSYLTLYFLIVLYSWIHCIHLSSSYKDTFTEKTKHCMGSGFYSVHRLAGPINTILCLSWTVFCIILNIQVCFCIGQFVIAPPAKYFLPSLHPFKFNWIIDHICAFRIYFSPRHVFYNKTLFHLAMLNFRCVPSVPPLIFDSLPPPAPHNMSSWLLWWCCAMLCKFNI